MNLCVCLCMCRRSLVHLNEQIAKQFAGQYYNVLQHQPDILYRFYNEKSKIFATDEQQFRSPLTIASQHNIHTHLMSTYGAKVNHLGTLF